MDPRLAILTVPSLLVLGFLVAHSFRALPRARAGAFWGSVLAYGLLRGVGVRWVIAQLPGASFPYAMPEALAPLWGVPLQEIAGWAIVAYLGWWLATRLSPRVFAQIACACLFLAAVSLAIETAAVAAGWWRWTVPASQPLLGSVPPIALVDWGLVGTDFLLPFLALTAPALRRHRLRWLALLAFPLHFGAHCFADRSLGAVPVHHVAHWVLTGGLLWLILRSETRDEPFTAGTGWLPPAALAIVLLDAAAVELFLVRRPALLLSLLPAIAVALQALVPWLGTMAAACALVAGLWIPSLLLAAVPAGAAGALRWSGPRPRWAAGLGLAVLALFAYRVHAAAAEHRDTLVHGLDAAIAARDGGDLQAARQILSGVAAEFPGAHVPLVLLGEIEYRTDRLEAARDAFSRAAAIKGDDPAPHRYLAVIERRLGHRARSESDAARGLAIAPDDPELRYLAGDPVDPRDPRTTQALAALAFEVGDGAGAAAVLDRGLARWPGERSFYPARVKLALQAGDGATARRVLGDWRTRFPQDAEARQLAEHLSVN